MLHPIHPVIPSNTVSGVKQNSIKMTDESTTPATNQKPTSSARRRRNRKKKAKHNTADSQKEEQRQKELEFSKMNNHAKLRFDLIQQGFSAEQIDKAMDEMWNQNMSYDEYDHVYNYLKAGKKKPEQPKSTTTKITEAGDGGVEETKEVEVADLTPSQVNINNNSDKNKKKSVSPKRGKTSLNSMAARLDLVAGFDNLADAIFAMTEWVIKAAKPNEVSIIQISGFSDICLYCDEILYSLSFRHFYFFRLKNCALRSKPWPSPKSFDDPLPNPQTNPNSIPPFCPAWFACWIICCKSVGCQPRTIQRVFPPLSNRPEQCIK